MPDKLKTDFYRIDKAAKIALTQHQLEVSKHCRLISYEERPGKVYLQISEGSSLEKIQESINLLCRLSGFTPELSYRMAGQPKHIELMGDLLKMSVDFVKPSSDPETEKNISIIRAQKIFEHATKMILNNSVERSYTSRPGKTYLEFNNSLSDENISGYLSGLCHYYQLPEDSYRKSALSNNYEISGELLKLYKQNFPTEKSPKQGPEPESPGRASSSHRP